MKINNKLKLIVTGVGIFTLMTGFAFAGEKELGADGKIKEPEKKIEIKNNIKTNTYTKPVIMKYGNEYIDINNFEKFGFTSSFNYENNTLEITKGDNNYSIEFSEQDNPIKYENQVFVPMKMVFERIGVDFEVRKGYVYAEEGNIKENFEYAQINDKVVKYKNDNKKTFNYDYKKVFKQEKKYDEKKNIKKHEIKDLTGSEVLILGEGFIGENALEDINLEAIKDIEGKVDGFRNLNNGISIKSLCKKIGNYQYISIKELKSIDVEIQFINKNQVEIKNGEVIKKIDVKYLD
ncbi:hypothetical protein [Tepidibacter hydrothermalis]|uniref:Copper amine oxidase-like N-terminal domain-containing protein n=1 Tax=Tepidibacter hydrothermalis TaxID=3036126 RepID=A0ABY8EFC2_9FIRM|nr:hypothetical protein [Tepidibacter hydrothermalis]WFD10469.1 hypothetical protein P4S50_19770 [Tepidibacter hydrothermalis]